MKNRFVGHYRPTEEEFKKLWSECLFLPDANILLHLFRYGEKTRAQVLATLQQLKPRVWIPYRVGFEFHRRWRDVDQINRDAYGKLKHEIEVQGRKISGLFSEYTRHQTIDAKEEQRLINEFLSALYERLSKSETKHPSRGEAEAVFNQVSELVGDAVGECPTADEFQNLTKIGEQRFAAQIPPGYRDAKAKEGADKYGDYFIWQEALEKSKEAQKPIIIITDDVKEDWWQEHHGAKIGPRPELIAEMMQFSGQQFYLYTLSQFLDYAEKFLNRKIDAEAIDEIKSDENQLREVAKRNDSIRLNRDALEHTRQYSTRISRSKEMELRAQRSRLKAKLELLNDQLEQFFVDENVENIDELRVRGLLSEKREINEMINEISEKLQVSRESRWARNQRLDERTLTESLISRLTQARIAGRDLFQSGDSDDEN